MELNGVYAWYPHNIYFKANFTRGMISHKRHRDQFSPAHQNTNHCTLLFLLKANFHTASSLVALRGVDLQRGAEQALHTCWLGSTGSPKVRVPHCVLAHAHLPPLLGTGAAPVMSTSDQSDQWPEPLQPLEASEQIHTHFWLYDSQLY